MEREEKRAEKEKAEEQRQRQREEKRVERETAEEQRRMEREEKRAEKEKAEEQRQRQREEKRAERERVEEQRRMQSKHKERAVEERRRAEEQKKREYEQRCAWLPSQQDPLCQVLNVPSQNMNLMTKTDLPAHWSMDTTPNSPNFPIILNPLYQLNNAQPLSRMASTANFSIAYPVPDQPLSRSSLLPLVYPLPAAELFAQASTCADGVDFPTNDEELARIVHLHSRYATCAERFASLTADNVEIKMRSFCTSLAGVYGDLPFARLDWATSITGTLVGLICAQTCKNSWSSIGYANLAATFPTSCGEPDWDLIRTRKVEDIVPCIWHGPYFYRKAEVMSTAATMRYS